MKILITNQHLVNYAGTENYIYTLARLLKEAGHQVVVYSLVLGEAAERIRETEIKVVDDLEEVSSERFEVIHGHHRKPTFLAFCFFPLTPIIYVSHGVIPRVIPFEAPPDPPVVVERFVAVSEEVKANLIGKFGIPEKEIEVVVNPVDVERFKPRKEIGGRLKKVLLISSNRSPEQKEMVEQACSRLGLNLEVIGWEERVWNVEEHINEADLVVALGRGVIEGLACGRAVVVFDSKGCDGMLTEGNIDLLLETNFSGKRCGRESTVEALIGEFEKYDPQMLEMNRRLALERFDARKVMERLMEIYRQATISCSQDGESAFERRVSAYHSYLKGVARLALDTPTGDLRAEITRRQEEMAALQAMVQRQQEEIATLQELVRRYQEGRFIRSMAALHRLKERLWGYEQGGHH